jgi:hypothetical protein
MRAAVAIDPNTSPLQFARYANILLREHSAPGREVLAHEHYPGGALERVIKAATSAGSTSDPNWAGGLYDMNVMLAAFENSLAPTSVLDALWATPCVQVPLHTVVAVVSSILTGDVVGEGQAKPAHQFTIASGGVLPRKIVAFCAVSRELLRFAINTAAAVLNTELQIAISRGSNAALLGDLSVGASLVTATTDFAADLARALAGMAITPESRIVIAIPQSVLTNLALTHTAAGGAFAYPGLRVNGGTISGCQVVPVDDATLTTTSGSEIVVMDATGIAIGKDVITLDQSEEASVQMNSTPDNPVTANTVAVSLWQRNLVGLKAERYAGWQALRSTAVTKIIGASYVP